MSVEVNPTSYSPSLRGSPCVSTSRVGLRDSSFEDSLSETPSRVGSRRKSLPS